MAQYLCVERPAPLLGQDPPAERGGHGLPGPSRGEPSRGHGLPGSSEKPRQTREQLRDPIRDPIRSGRDALLASLDRPLGGGPGRAAEPSVLGEQRRPAVASGGAAALIGGGPGSAFDDDSDAPKEVPAVPSLAVLRPRRTSATADAPDQGSKPRKRLPSWDDVLFGTGPAARESS
jgi:hypothetical protein